MKGKYYSNGWMPVWFAVQHTLWAGKIRDSDAMTNMLFG